MHKLPISFHISRMTLNIFFIISLRMISIYQEIRMIPVKKRKIQANLQTFCPESINILFHKITAKFCICNLIIRKLRIPKRKTFMMFCRQNCILKSCLFCFFCPFPCIKEIRVKIIKILFISFCSNLFQSHYPFMSCCY